MGEQGPQPADECDPWHGPNLNQLAASGKDGHTSPVSARAGMDDVSGGVARPADGGDDRRAARGRGPRPSSPGLASSGRLTHCFRGGAAASPVSARGAGLHGLAAAAWAPQSARSRAPGQPVVEGGERTAVARYLRGALARPRIPGPGVVAQRRAVGPLRPRPSPRAWYLAHNVTIVRAFLDHRDLAERENRVERFFINLVLVRVLYAHALVAAPRLALAWLAPDRSLARRSAAGPDRHVPDRPAGAARSVPAAGRARRLHRRRARARPAPRRGRHRATPRRAVPVVGRRTADPGRDDLVTTSRRRMPGTPPIGALGAAAKATRPRRRRALPPPRRRTA